MNQQRIMLAGTTFDSPVIHRLCDVYNVVGVYLARRGSIKDLSVQQGSDFASLLESTRPDACVVLSPIPSLSNQIEDLIIEGVSVLCAGPIHSQSTVANYLTGPSSNLTISSPQTYSPVYERIVHQSQRAAFGESVYLRYFSRVGPGLAGAWWSACQALDQACRLLAADVVSAVVIATRIGTRYHLNITLKMSNRANAQLTLVPEYLDDESDYTLLGTGGLLNYSARDNTSGIISKQRLQSIKRPDQCSHCRWIGAFGEGRESIRPTIVSSDLLPLLYLAIRKARKTGEPVNLLDM
ncbi:MAG: hypothetical protein HOH43_21925 [Candidatus Latescibacteria bacterium]|nr:hypothetical protein [Candidatus Latescibacterota bacterium]